MGSDSVSKDDVSQADHDEESDIGDQEEADNLKHPSGVDDDIEDDELANLDVEPPKDRKKKLDVEEDDDELLMMCGNEDLMRQ